MSRQTLARYWAHLLLLAVQERALHLCRPACQCCEVPSCAANARIDESDSQCRTFFIKRRGKRGVCALATHQAAIANAFGAVDQAAPICEAARPRRDEGATPCNIIARTCRALHTRELTFFTPPEPAKGCLPREYSAGHSERGH